MQTTVKTNTFKGEHEVKAAIIFGLTAYYILAKEALRKRWKKLSQEDKLAEMRGLVSMNMVAKNPDKYLSRLATESDWYARAEKYAKEKGINALFFAFYIVPSPADMVFNDSSNVLYQDLSNQYYNFLKKIQSYEYDNGNMKDVYGKEVMEESKRVCAELSHKKAKGLVNSIHVAENCGPRR